MQLGCLKTIFTSAIQKAFPQVASQEFGVGIITRCGNPSFGDFQCNNSLAIAKYFKTFSNYSGKQNLFSFPFYLQHSVYVGIQVNYILLGSHKYLLHVFNIHTLSWYIIINTDIMVTS